MIDLKNSELAKHYVEELHLIKKSCILEVQEEYALECLEDHFPKSLDIPHLPIDSVERMVPTDNCQQCRPKHSMKNPVHDESKCGIGDFQLTTYEDCAN